MVIACVCDYNSRAFSETLALAFHNVIHMPLLKNKWYPFPSKTIFCLIRLRHLCGNVLLDHLWKRGKWKGTETINTQNTKTSWFHSSSGKYDDLLNSSDNSSNWQWQPLINKSSGHHWKLLMSYVSVEAIYSDRKHLNPAWRYLGKFIDDPSLETFFSMVQQLSYIFIAWNYRTRQAFAVRSQPWVIHEFPKLSPAGFKRFLSE